jgi:hypothetical protein
MTPALCWIDLYIGISFAMTRRTGVIIFRFRKASLERGLSMLSCLEVVFHRSRPGSNRPDSAFISL